MQNSETLRGKLFQTLDGLADGSIDPAKGKAIAATAMAICKTVELDLRASEIFKSGGSMTSLRLTSDAENPVAVQDDSSHEDEPENEIIATDEQVELIMKGHKNGLPVATIAKRLKLDVTDVALVIESRK